MLTAVKQWLGVIGAHPLGRRAPARTLLRMLKWQIRARSTSGPIVQPWIGDARLIARRGMTGATGNFYFGLHEYADMAFVMHLLRPGDLFLDIGANIGSYTVLASKVCGAETWAFEPARETLVHLRGNVAINAIDAHVTIYDVALGDTDGEVAFTTGLDSVNHVAEDDDVAVQQVLVKRLDEIAAAVDPVLIKMDVEGFELAVVQGAQATLRKPSLLAIEVETVAPETQALIEGAGFVLKYYDPERRTLGDVPNGYRQNNALFVRNEAAIAGRLKQAPRRAVYGMSL